MDYNHFSSKLTNRIHLCILDISHNFEIAICSFALILLNYRLQGLSLLTISQTKSFVVIKITPTLCRTCLRNPTQALKTSQLSNIHKRIRFVNSDVPLIRLVLLENDVIPNVLLVQNKFLDFLDLNYNYYIYCCYLLLFILLVI